MDHHKQQWGDHGGMVPIRCDHIMAPPSRVTWQLSMLGSAALLNDKRPKLSKLLASTGRFRIVSEHKDRLTRFGFHYLELLLDGEIIIANLEDNDCNDRNDLMQDLISVITSMTARYYGQRRGSKKTKKLISELEEE